MASDLSFACDCGTVTGTMRVISGEGDHVVCHCTDCQNFTHFLDHAHILDREGGTALYQTRCARMRIDSGRERLACFHLTDGPTLRWYAVCCRTPLFNTYANGKVPVLTVLLATCDAAARERLIGPPRGHLFVAEGIGDTSGLRKLRMATLMRRFLVRAVKDLISGDRRRAELFEAKTLAPIATPHRLTDAERQALKQRQATAALPL
jgi:hypothetical protein